MSRVSDVVAACVCIATLSVAAPAAAVPAEPMVRAEDARTKNKTDQPRPSVTPASDRIKEIALSQVGAPYSYGGTSPAGFDCSGFTSWVYSHMGVTLPHSSSAQYSLGGSDGFETVPSIDDLLVGDLVFHATGGSGVGHAGIYIGDGSFVSATTSEGVQVRSLFDSYWGPLWVGGVRVYSSGK